jgi:nucleoid DNA-binding protein
MNNKEFIAELAQRTGHKQEATQRMVRTFVEVLGESFEAGEAVNLPKFGTFEVKKRLERTMVNPNTGQRMLVPPKLVLAFKPNPTWKDKIKKGGAE